MKNLFKGEKKNKETLLLYFIIISLLIHIFVFWGFHETIQSSHKVEKKPEAVWIKLPPKQIADIAKPKVQERPEQAKAEGLYDQKVKEETVAKKSIPQPQSAPQKGQPEIKKKPPPQKKEASPAKPKNENELKPKKANDLGLKPLEKKNISKDIQNHNQPSSTKAQPHIPGMPEATQSTGADRRLFDDTLPTYRYGNRTYINVMANPHVQYFVELKRKFQMAFSWRNAVLPHMPDIYGKRVQAIVGFTIDKSGNLVQTVTIRSSGYQAFDGETKRTIKVSSPFSSPPINLLDEKGELNVTLIPILLP